MAKHRNRTDLKIKYVSDNLELINRSKEYLNHKHQNQKTLSAKYYITEQIYLTNKTYKIDAPFQHVYGYQDTDSRGKLSMEAKLNIVAHKLAGQYQDQLGPY